MIVRQISRSSAKCSNTEAAYLCGRLAYETVRGMQESVLSSVKHYIGNEQETNRNPEGNFTSSSSNIDDRYVVYHGGVILSFH